MRVAIEGCMHGELDDVYASIRHLEEENGIKVDLLICCGDFQAIRNVGDLQSMAVPDKYKELGTFHQYYSGEKVAPYPTLFIGGNHEASNHLWELYYGGWVAPNIYYMGCSGVVRFGGLRIGGLSGIYDERNYRCGHFEFPPYDRGALRSVYHVREFEVRKLLHIKDKLDVFLSHDWPRGVANCGCCDRARLIRNKPYFRQEIDRDELGSPAAAQLCNRLKPSYWFSAHLHVKFPAIIRHDTPRVAEDSLTAMLAKLALAKAQGDSAPTSPPPQSPEPAALTRFLALDKCLPNRDFLQIVDFPSHEGPKCFEYDVEWLAILKRLQGEMPMDRGRASCPTGAASCLPVTPEERSWIERRLEGCGGTRIPLNFSPVAPTQAQFSQGRFERRPHYVSQQTTTLLKVLDLPYILNQKENHHHHHHHHHHHQQHHHQQQHRQYQQGQEYRPVPGPQSAPAGLMVPTGVMLNYAAQHLVDQNPEEIHIDDDDGAGGAGAGDGIDTNPEEIEI